MAFCHSHGWSAPMGGSIRSIKTANAQKIGALGVRFSGPSERDLADEYFSSETDFGPTLGSGAPVMLNHGTALADTELLTDFADVILAPATVTKSAKGLWVETTLDLSDPLQEAIAELVQLGCLSWSSGTAGHVAKKRAADGLLLRWFPVEWSMTPWPCEPRLPALALL